MGGETSVWGIVRGNYMSRPHLTPTARDVPRTKRSSFSDLSLWLHRRSLLLPSTQATAIASAACGWITSFRIGLLSTLLQVVQGIWYVDLRMREKLCSLVRFQRDVNINNNFKKTLLAHRLDLKFQHDLSVVVSVQYTIQYCPEINRYSMLLFCPDWYLVRPFVCLH